MNKFVMKPWMDSGTFYLSLLLISFIINITIAFTQFNIEWRVMTFVWFSSSLVIFLFRNKFKLTNSGLFLWQVITVLYPIIEMIIRLGLKFDYLPDNIYLNSFSHILFSFALYNLVFPIMKIFQGNMITYIILCFAFTNVLGNLNEIFQFYTRTNLLNPWYYQDTIRDIMMNLIGSFIGSIISLISLKLNREKIY